MRIKIVTGILAGIFLTSPGFAAETYVIDPAHSHVMFKVERFGLSNTIGGFVDVAGAVSLDKNAPEKSSVTATVKIASVDSNNAEREGHLRGPSWLDAEQFPLMTFTSTQVEQTGESTAKVTGDLTLHGVTRPLTLNVTLHKIGADPVSKREAAGFTATGSLKRGDFGMMTAQGLIGDAVEISIEALAVAGE